MTTPDLDVLGALTRDYAAFQSRKSGLATALGGLMAILLALAALSPDLMGARVTGRLLVEYLVWMPFLWLALKWGVGRVLYRGLGPVKPSPDAAYERRRWFWIQGLALFLLAVLLAGLYAFASGLMQVNPSRAALCPRALGPAGHRGGPGLRGPGRPMHALARPLLSPQLLAAEISVAACGMGAIW